MTLRAQKDKRECTPWDRKGVDAARENSNFSRLLPTKVCAVGRKVRIGRAGKAFGVPLKPYDGGRKKPRAFWSGWVEETGRHDGSGR